MHGDVLLDVAAGVSGSRRAAPWRRRRAARAASSRASSAFSRSGSSASAALGVVRGRVEPLQGDQAFEISVHGVREPTKKAPPMRSLNSTRCDGVSAFAGCVAAVGSLAVAGLPLSSSLGNLARANGGPTRIRTWNRPVMSRRL